MKILLLRLSGLIVDVFGDVAVVASSAAWVERYKLEIESCINKVDGISHINWRPSIDILKEEGLDLLQLKHTPASPLAQVEVFPPEGRHKQRETTCFS